MKNKYIILICLSLFCANFLSAQDKPETREEKRQKRIAKANSLAYKEVTGEIVYKKYFSFSIIPRTNGYGISFEKGFYLSPLKAKFFMLEIDETKDKKEVRQPRGRGIINQTYIYGKENYFYPVKLGYGYKYTLGKKGTQSGVSVNLSVCGGLALGLLRPYYVNVVDNTTSTTKYIKYEDDKDLFLSDFLVGNGGLGRGWGEMEVKPGLFVKPALVFDYGKTNRLISAIEIGGSLEYYSEKIPILVNTEGKDFFFQGHVALTFGSRK